MWDVVIYMRWMICMMLRMSNDAIYGVLYEMDDMHDVTNVFDVRCDVVYEIYEMHDVTNIFDVECDIFHEIYEMYDVTNIFDA